MEPRLPAPAAEKTAAERPARSPMKEIWREWIRPFVYVLIVVSTLRSAVADWNDVPTGSMKPTILEGERIFVNKLAYDLKFPFTLFRLARWDDPERGDVVVLFSPADEKRLVKRVIGLPGDVIEMRDNRLFINGREADYQPYDEETLDRLAIAEELTPQVVRERLGLEDHPVMWLPWTPFGSSFAPLEIPEDHYFVMGDNRNQSRDSRVFGLVARDRIVGRATAVVISVDPERHYAPRWQRFFHSLP